MSLLSLLFAILSFASVEDANLRFQYVPNEGGEIRNCTHQRIRDLPDWSIRCEGMKKEFAAHVVIREHQRGASTSFEILYWVTDRGENSTTRPIFHSTTTWVHLKKAGEAASLSLSQGVENDYASLVMEWKPGIER